MLFMKKKPVTLLATATALVGLAATPALANPPSGVPGLARNVALAVNGPLATLSWSAPADIGSSAITGYTGAIAYGNQQQVTCHTTGATSCVINIGFLGVGYTIVGKVTATNSVGDSEVSQAAQFAQSGLRIFFPSASGVLTAGQKLQLKIWMSALCRPGACLPFAYHVTGYTDTSVSGAAATRQCMARANAVANYLTSIIPAGLPSKPTFIAVSGGATNRWDKKNPAGNRRVDFTVVPG